MIVGVIVLAAVGVLLTVLGLLIWKKEKIANKSDKNRKDCLDIFGWSLYFEYIKKTF